MSTFEQLKTEAQRIADVKYAAAVLNWDMEINMHANGVEARSRQLATLSGIAFEMGTSEKFSNLLQAAKDDSSLDVLQKRNVELLWSDFQKAKKFSQEFVEEMSMTVSQSFAAWEHAKKANDFSLYAPQLEKMIALKRKQAEIIGYEKHPYDALLDDYEPGMTATVLDEYFKTVRSGLKPLLEKIKAQPHVDNRCLHQHFDRQQQPTWVFSTRPLPLIPTAGIHLVRGDVRTIHTEMRQAAGSKNIWIVGGVNRAAQFYDASLLDEVIVQIGSVTLGAGKPLFPRRVTNPPLRLISVHKIGPGFAELRYDVPKEKPAGPP